jgi:hypothetical protein
MDIPNGNMPSTTSKGRKKTDIAPQTDHYDILAGGVSELLEEPRRTTARTINSILTVSYWEVGRRIVEFEQGG